MGKLALVITAPMWIPLTLLVLFINRDGNVNPECGIIE